MTPFARAGRRSLAMLLLSVVGLSIGDVDAAGDWYVGIGGGVSRLAPDAAENLDVDEKNATTGTVIFGRDLDETTSMQLQLHGLGSATFVNEQDVDYYAADAAVLYRLLDSRDRSRSAAGIAFYGRFGLGYMRRDADLDLENDAPIWFGAGAGLEVALNRRLAVRTEGLYFDTDAAAAYLSVIGRFGGARTALQRRPRDRAARDPQSSPAHTGATPATATVDPGSAPELPAQPKPPVPGPRAGTDDSDGDGVIDVDDVCLQSTPGFPVRSNGCALFDGVLNGVTFVERTAELAPGASTQLDLLADLLERYPQARIELHTHTDTRGTPRDQAILTRARLRTVGLYLVGRGVSGNRLVLRSFGGSRPLRNGSIAQDNRVEVRENVR